MRKKYYHATSYENLFSIMEKGLTPGIDGIVYLTETRFDALKFIAIRCVGDILTLEVELEESEVEETFDHSYSFFNCKSFGYPKTIPFENIDVDGMRLHPKE